MTSQSQPIRRAIDKPQIDQRVQTARLALHLQRQGKSLWQIADALGLSHTQTVASIKDALNEAAALVDEASKRELLTLEMSRLDELQDAQWAAAMSGDTKAAEFILKVIDKRAKLLGLVSDDKDEKTTVQTVVVTGDSRAYIEALRAITVPAAIEQGEADG